MPRKSDEIKQQLATRKQQRQETYLTHSHASIINSLVVTKVDHYLNVWVVGAPGSGKSSLIERYVEGTYQVKTANDCFEFRTIEMDDKNLRLRIHDTQTDDYETTYTSSLKSECHCVIICFDLNDFNSLTLAHTQILPTLRTFLPENQAFMLVGTKHDLIENGQQVWQGAAEEIANSQKLPYVLTSAANNTDIELAFQTAAMLGLDNLRAMKQTLSRRGYHMTVPDMTNQKACQTCLIL